MCLLRMCLKTKKPLLACSCAMYGLIYISASNIKKDINIINGKGRGGTFDEIDNF